MVSSTPRVVCVTYANLFSSYTFNFLTSSFFEIKRLAMHLKRNKKTKIKIAGHTDNTGSEKYNLELSKKRAKSVYDKLLEFGEKSVYIPAFTSWLSKNTIEIDIFGA